MTCCNLVNGRPAGGGSPAYVASSYELDFSSIPPAALATGPVVLDGLTWEARADLDPGVQFGFDGSGLRYQCSAPSVSTSYTATTQTSDYLRLPLSELYARLDCDSLADLAVDIYLESWVWSAGNPEVRAGISGESGAPPSSAGRIAAAVRGLASGVDRFNSFGTSSSFNYLAAPNVLGLYQSADGIGQVYGATWTGSWPRPEYSIGVQPYEVGPLRDSESAVFLAFPTNGVSSAQFARVQRIRFRAWQRR